MLIYNKDRNLRMGYSYSNVTVNKQLISRLRHWILRNKNHFYVVSLNLSDLWYIQKDRSTEAFINRPSNTVCTKLRLQIRLFTRSNLTLGSSYRPFYRTTQGCKYFKSSLYLIPLTYTQSFLNNDISAKYSDIRVRIHFENLVPKLGFFGTHLEHQFKGYRRIEYKVMD